MPEQEPNDTPDEADDLSGGCISGNVDPGSDVDMAAFQLDDGQTYDVQLAPSGDANVALYKWVGYWGQVASTSPTEIDAHVPGRRLLPHPGVVARAADAELPAHAHGAVSFRSSTSARRRVTSSPK